MTDLPKTPPRIAASLVDPLTYSEAHGLHNDFTWLRANLPVSRAEVSGFDPFWVVTKHADIAEISRQNAPFHNGDRPTVLTDAASEAFVRKLEERIRTIARAQVARMIERRGECDFVRDVAVMYPLHVIMEILGVPREDEQRMLLLTQQLFGSQDPELNRSRQVVLDMAEMVKQLQAVVADFSDYFRKLTESRRTQPRDDVATVIANAQIDGRPISDFEAMGYYIIIAAAGHDTTSSSTCGAMWALCEQPGELEKLRANPALIPGLVEEAMRWTVPVQHFMRTAMEDYTLRGVPIAKGDWLMLCYLSANRDEEVFDAPFAFRSDRSPNKHISFGTGAHACLGQHLARLEMRVLFEELIPKIKSVALTGEPRRSASTFVGGPKTLPMRYQLN